MKRLFTIVTCLLILAGLAGCASYEGLSTTIQPKSAPIAAGWRLNTDWWLIFADPQLNQLIDEALLNSPTVAKAASRIQWVSRQATLEAAQLNAIYAIDGAATRQEFSALGYFPPPIGGNVFNLGQLQADFSWDIDWWGKHRAVYQQTVGELTAAHDDSQQARLILSISVADAYFALQADQARSDLIQKIADKRRTLLQLQRDRVTAGLASDLPLRPLQGNIALLEREAADVNGQSHLDRAAIGALLGQAPQRGEQVKVGDLTQVPQLPSNLPADLIGLRPDVNAQRANIQVAAAHNALAKIAFYPDINLSGFVGLQSIGLDNVFKSGSEMFSVGPAVHLPIFDSQSLRATLGARYAEYDMAVEDYNQTVIDAMRQTASASINLIALARQSQAQQRLQDSLQQSTRLAEQRYQHGLDNDLPVIEAELAQLAAQQSYIQLHQRRLASTLAMIRALGGLPTRSTVVSP